jgi:RecB family endonuclease NucS
MLAVLLHRVEPSVRGVVVAHRVTPLVRCLAAQGTGLSHQCVALSLRTGLRH